MKKLVLVGIGLGLAVSVLADSSAPKLPTFTKAVTLKFWDWGASDKAMIAAFNKDYPSIKVEWANVGAGPDEYNKLLTALKAGTGAPDIAAIEYGFLPSFIAFGGLVDLAKYGANDYKNLYPEWAWRQVSPEGSAVYGVPGDQGPLALVYREDQYKRYGLTVPKTWAQFEANAIKLSNATKGKVKIANFFSTYAPWYMGLVWAAGGKFWTKNGDAWTQSFGNPQSKTVLNYWGKLIEKGYVSTLQNFTQDFYKALDSDNIISSVEAAWGPGTFAGSLTKKTAGKWRVAPLPQWSSGTPFKTGNWGGTSYAVTTQSKEPQAALIFSLWMMAHPTAIKINWVTQGVFPAAKAGLSLPELQDPKLDPNRFFGTNVAAAYLEASKHVDSNFIWSPWFLYANDNFNKHLADAIAKKITWNKALENWQSEVLTYAQSQSFSVTGK